MPNISLCTACCIALCTAWHCVWAHAGASVQFGQTSVISNNGVFVAVGTASNTNAYYNLAYMYKKDDVTGRFRWELG